MTSKGELFQPLNETIAIGPTFRYAFGPMGLWSKLFGAGETPEQRIDRARQHLADREHELAVRTLRELDGDEAAVVRAQAIAAIEQRDMQPPPRAPRTPPSGPPYRAPGVVESKPGSPDPGASEPAFMMQFGADGSLRIGTGGGTSVTLNAPQSDDDGKRRSTDGVSVAHALLAASRDQSLDDPRAFAFVDAAFLVARAGSTPPRMRDPRRQAVLDLAVVSSTGDRARLATTIRTMSSAVADHACVHAVPMAVSFAARELAELCFEHRIHPTLQLVRALIADDAELCDRLAAQADPVFAGEVVVAAAMVGANVPGATSRWLDFTTLPQGEQRDTWTALAIRRAACTDLERALEMFDSHERYGHDEPELGLDLAMRLARVDLPRALARVRGLGRHLDHSGWFDGCVRTAGTAAIELVDEWLAALHPAVYHPYAYFSVVLEACIRLGDVARVRRCLEVAGPNGWQIACAARDALSATRADRSALLAALYKRVSAGFVSGRANSRDAIPFGVGTRVFQPAWLAFTKPHPIETLAMVAALGDAGPRWAER